MIWMFSLGAAPDLTGKRQTRLASLLKNPGYQDYNITAELGGKTGLEAPDLNAWIFAFPGERFKNGEERLVVLNKIAESIVESVRGLHPVYIFVRARTQRMRDTAAGKNLQHGVEVCSGTRGGCLGRAAWRSGTRGVSEH